MIKVATNDNLTHARQVDQYADSSWKVAFLLQLPIGSTILVDGKNGAALCAGLSRLSYRALELTRANAEDVHQAAALVVLPGAASTPKLVEATISKMRADAQVLVFFPHRWSTYAGVRSGVRNLLSHRSWTMRRATAIARSAERGKPQIWLPVPKHTVPEEFVALSEPQEMAASMACTERRARLRARLHDGFGIYGSPGGAGMGGLARMLESALEKNGFPCALRITRFDLRNRGALVLFVMDQANARAYVCRIVRGEVSEHLQRHWRLQASVRCDVQPHALQSRIPQEIATVRIDEHTCWIETRSPGTVSWRIPQRLRPVLDDQIVGFIADLAAVTGVDHVVSEADIDNEAALWADQIGTKLKGASADLLSEAYELLRERVVGAAAKFGWVHGDYGYGNVLADPCTGELSSVIDWETASSQSFVGVDLFNFLLQRARSRGSVREATDRVLREIESGDLGGGTSVSRYLARFLPDRTLQLHVLLLTLCRWLRREHRYGLRPPANSDDLRAALSLVRDACSSSRSPKWSS